jgi:hypothetical protein
MQLCNEVVCHEENSEMLGYMDLFIKIGCDGRKQSQPSVLSKGEMFK